MKVTQVAICPTEASGKAGRPALTPELLAASGARYSRNDEGLAAILSKIDPNHLDKSVDSIFRMVDYGHQSIADMVPVAIFIDGVSLWLAYYLWTLCPTAAGQESSTRYVGFSVDALVPPERLGIPAPEISQWRELMHAAFQAYQASLKTWEDLAQRDPALMGIPQALLTDGSPAAQKKVARLRRNYAFDRARYLLPVSAATNVMLIMSARAWVILCQHLLSHRLPEPQQLGELIRNELQLAAPRMLKYAQATESNQQDHQAEFEKLVQLAKSRDCLGDEPPTDSAESAKPFLSVMVPEGVSEPEITADLSYHPNRYSPVGSSLHRIAVRFGWSALGFAEIRDLNRHRTGTKYCPQVPSGFYFALDQVPAAERDHRAHLLQQGELGRTASAQALRLLRQEEPSVHLLVPARNGISVRTRDHRGQIHLRGGVADRSGGSLSLRQALAGRSGVMVPAVSLDQKPGAGGQRRTRIILSRDLSIHPASIQPMLR